MSVSFNCEEVDSLLDAYHDGELSAVEESGVASHIGSCVKCHKQLEEIEGLVKSLKSVPKLNVPNDLTADIAFINRALAAIDQSPSESKPEPKKVVTASDKPPARHISIAAPVTVAAIAAAAAVALFITVPRLLKTPLYSGNTVATHDGAHTKGTTNSVQPETNVAVVEPSNNTISEQPNENQSAAQPMTHAHPNSIGKEPLIAEHTPSASLPHKLDEAQTVPADNLSSNLDITGTNEDNTIAVTADNAQQGDHDSATSSASSSDGPDIVALYPSDNSNSPPEDLGISTDEDGLYAIKL
jgi:Putative zinc-finger